MPEEQQHNKTNILLVDNIPSNLNFLSDILSQEGFGIFLATHGKEALTTARRELPDLILLDVAMPDMDGYTLTSRLKNFPNMAKVPIIALTANVMRGDRERSLEAGCDGYIQKPIDVDTIGNQIRRFLGLKAV